VVIIVFLRFRTTAICILLAFFLLNTYFFSVGLEIPVVFGDHFSRELSPVIYLCFIKGETDVDANKDDIRLVEIVVDSSASLDQISRSVD